MRDDIENAYHIAEGQCLDAMYELRRLSGREAIECLKNAIRSVEYGQRMGEQKRRREMACIPAGLTTQPPPPTTEFS